MIAIKARPITNDDFRPYGAFASMLDPVGNRFPGDAAFYPKCLLTEHIAT